MYASVRGENRYPMIAICQKTAAHNQISFWSVKIGKLHSKTTALLRNSKLPFVPSPLCAILKRMQLEMLGGLACDDTFVHVDGGGQGAFEIAALMASWNCSCGGAYLCRAFCCNLCCRGVSERVRKL
jgi:hypothetical protein